MLKIIVLALVQGLTEFFPVSSKGHLALLEHFFVIPAPEKLFLTVFLHSGTLLATFIYFWPQIVQILTGLRLHSERGVVSRRYLGAIIIGTIPVFAVGFVLEEKISGLFSSLPLLAVMFLVTALVLVLADLKYHLPRPFPQRKTIKPIPLPRGERLGEGVSFPRALIVGCAQTFALLPGISRSGSTISAGLISGLSRQEAFRFSFLLSLPAVTGAFLLEIPKGLKMGSVVPVPLLILGFMVSFVFGLLALHLLRRLVLTGRLAWFSLYLLVLGLFTAFI